MPSNVKDLLNNIIDKNHIAAKDNLKELMLSKLEPLVDVQKIQVARKLFSEGMVTVKNSSGEDHFVSIKKKDGGYHKQIWNSKDKLVHDKIHNEKPMHDLKEIEK